MQIASRNDTICELNIASGTDMTIQKQDFKEKSNFDHSSIESKWQEKWAKDRTYSPVSLHKPKNPFYNLWMFPYPSAEGVHVGTIFSSTGSDVYGRYKRMNNCTVFQPFGYDSFGIHSENYAIKVGKTPQNMLETTIAHYESQFKMVGHGYDWNRTVTTSNIDYYQYTQWLFVTLFKAGLAYRKKQAVNWCPGCKTVLADEQIQTPREAGKVPPGYSSLDEVPDGIKVCERCGNIPEIKDLEQWFFRITAYADRLLEGQSRIDWSERVSVAQKNWIGKSEGVYVDFKVDKTDKVLTVFTTAIETIFGATFMVISPEHPILSELEIPTEHSQKVSEYIKKHTNTSENIDGLKEKTGVFTGLFVKHPLKDVTIPIWVSDYVLMQYGTGAIMAVPAHDSRDREFAQNYDLPIVPVIKPRKETYSEIVEGDGYWDYSEIKSEYLNDSLLFDSEEFNNLSSSEAKEKITKRIEDDGVGYAKSNYHLRDWLISRQRYWGPPIPMIYCEECARSGKSWFDIENNSQKLLHSDQSDWNPVGWYPEERLPVELPLIEDYKPKGEGKGPLADHPEFYKVTCPFCGSDARRETDVSDTFLDSSWYFLRYPSVGSNPDSFAPFDPEITKSWLPVDLYFGGAEHAVLHLMYSRFVTKVLHDLDYLSFDEPFPKFFAHGLMIKDGAKMSKSRGNVVNPDEYIAKFGADTLRLYIMFMGPMDGYPDFRDTGIEGMRRFVEKVWKLYQRYSHIDITESESQELVARMHKTIKRVTEDIESFRYNTAIAAIMEYVNFLRDIAQRATEHNIDTDDQSQKSNSEWIDALKVLTQLLAPFAPHISEEVWHSIFSNQESVHLSSWPVYDDRLVREAFVTIAIQVNGKLRGTLTVERAVASNKEEILTLAKADSNTSKWITGQEIKNEIFVPEKLVNFVV